MLRGRKGEEGGLIHEYVERKCANGTLTVSEVLHLLTHHSIIDGFAFCLEPLRRFMNPLRSMFI